MTRSGDRRGWLYRQPYGARAARCRREGRRARQSLDGLSLGGARGRPRSSTAMSATRPRAPLLVARYDVDAIIHFAGDDRGAGFGRRSARLLSQQHLQVALADRLRGRGARSRISSSPRPPRSTACRAKTRSPRMRRSSRISPYGRSKLMTEIDARRCGAAHELRYVALRYFNVAGADPQGRSGQSTPRATHLIKVACAGGARASGLISKCSAPTIRRRTAPACATTSM